MVFPSSEEGDQGEREKWFGGVVRGFPGHRTSAGVVVDVGGDGQFFRDTATSFVTNFVGRAIAHGFAFSRGDAFVVGAFESGRAIVFRGTLLLAGQGLLVALVGAA